MFLCSKFKLELVTVLTNCGKRLGKNQRAKCRNLDFGLRSNDEFDVVMNPSYFKLLELLLVLLVLLTQIQYC